MERKNNLSMLHNFSILFVIATVLISIVFIVACSKSDEKQTTTTGVVSEESTTLKVEKDTSSEKSELSSDEESSSDTTSDNENDTTTENETTTTETSQTTTYQSPTTTVQQTTTVAPQTTQPATQPTTTVQQTTAKTFVRYEEETNSNGEGYYYAVFSDGSRELSGEICWRRDLAEELFAKIQPLRESEGASYGLESNEMAATWNEEWYKLCQQRCLEISNDFSHNGCPNGFRENIIYGFSPTADDAWSGWMNSAAHKRNFIWGGTSPTGEAVACYQYGYILYWVYLAQ